MKKDIEELELNLSLHDIKLMSHEKLQKTVQQSVKVAAFRWLSEKTSNSKKVKNIPHGRLEIVKYLSDPILSTSQAKFLFSLRSRMIFVRENYSKMQKETTCPLCSTEENPKTDSQEHLLECHKLENASEVSEVDVSYSDLFSENETKQARMTMILERKYNQRKLMLENLNKI